MPATASKEEFVDGMRLFPAAVNLICCGTGSARAGFTATAVMSLTAEPAELAVAVGRNVSAFDQITSGGVFTVNTLSSDQIEMAGNFAGRLKGAARFSVGEWSDSPCGPRLHGALLVFECEIRERIELSTHCLLLARVRAVHRAPELRPLLYVEGDWASLMPLGGLELEAFLAPVRDSIDAIERATERGGSPEERLARFVLDFTDVYIQRQRESRAFFSAELYVRREDLEEINRHKRDFDHRLTALLEEGRAAGVFTFEDARLTALAITGMIGWTHRWFRPDGRMSPDDVGRQFARLTLRMLGANADCVKPDTIGTVQQGEAR